MTQMIQVIQDTLGRVVIGDAATFEGLSVFPLFDPGAPAESDYVTLEEAIERGLLEVKEVSEEGRVPELTLVNKGDRRVLLIDGEELRGTKQNRVLNISILAPAGRTIGLPVSCVEQGRWASRSATMASSPDVLFARARLAKMASVSESYRRSGAPESDQGGVWSAIADKADELAVASPTLAMSDIFEGRRRDVDAFTRAFAPAEGQAGAVFAVGGRVTGVELFEHPDHCRRLLPKLVRSWALDALGAEAGAAAPGADAAQAFLADVAGAEAQVFGGVGAGDVVRIESARVTGSGLVVDGRLAHLAAFSRNGG